MLEAHSPSIRELCVVEREDAAVKFAEYHEESASLIMKLKRKERARELSLSSRGERI